MVSEAGPNGTVGWQYDLADRRTRMTWPDSFYVGYQYTVAGELTEIDENGSSSGASRLANFAYDNFGRRQTLTRGNSTVTTWGYDPVSRLQSLQHDLAGTAYDETLTFDYNPASQVNSRASTNPGFYGWNGRVSVDRGSTINALNQIASQTTSAQAFSYDARGNLTFDGSTTYGYDAADRMTNTSNGAALSYDADDRLAQFLMGSTTTKFLYDGANLVGEYSSSGTLLHRYVHGPGADEPLVWYDVNGAGKQWLIADQQGSIIAVTNGAGTPTSAFNYDEYGNGGSAPSGQSSLSRFRYTGQAFMPEIGLYNYKARVYSPSLGRFMQTDPIGCGDGPNPYAYVHDDPADRGDSSGLAPKQDDFCGDDPSCARVYDAGQPGRPTADSRSGGQSGDQGKKADSTPPNDGGEVNFVYIGGIGTWGYGTAGVSTGVVWWTDGNYVVSQPFVIGGGHLGLGKGFQAEVGYGGGRASNLSAFLGQSTYV